MTFRNRCLIVAIAVIAAGAPRSIAAQGATGAPRVDTMRIARMLPRASRASVAAGCLTLRVTPGDTAGRAMPRASGDTLVDTRMPRTTSAAPACEPVRGANDAFTPPRVQVIRP